MFKQSSKKWVIEQEELEEKFKNFSEKSKHSKMKDVPNPMHYNVKYLTNIFFSMHAKKKVLSDCFPDFDLRHPPSGSGDCAAPKLLQYALKTTFTPFVWVSFGGEQHRQRKFVNTGIFILHVSRCRPILGHMLKGLEVEENPLLTKGEDKPMPIVYEDEDLVVVDKPAGLLSVPGVEIEDSALSRIKDKYPNATGAILVTGLI